MGYTFCKFRGESVASSTDLNQGLADDRYINQNFEERLLFNID